MKKILLIIFSIISINYTYAIDEKLQDSDVIIGNYPLESANWGITSLSNNQMIYAGWQYATSIPIVHTTYNTNILSSVSSQAWATFFSLNWEKKIITKNNDSYNFTMFGWDTTITYSTYPNAWPYKLYVCNEWYGIGNNSIAYSYVYNTWWQQWGAGLTGCTTPQTWLWDYQGAMWQLYEAWSYSQQDVYYFETDSYLIKISKEFNNPDIEADQLFWYIVIDKTTKSIVINSSINTPSQYIGLDSSLWYNTLRWYNIVYDYKQKQILMSFLGWDGWYSTYMVGSDGSLTEVEALKNNWVIDYNDRGLFFINSWDLRLVYKPWNRNLSFFGIQWEKVQYVNVSGQLINWDFDIFVPPTPAEWWTSGGYANNWIKLQNCRTQTISRDNIAAPINLKWLSWSCSPQWDTWYIQCNTSFSWGGKTGYIDFLYIKEQNNFPNISGYTKTWTFYMSEWQRIAGDNKYIQMAVHGDVPVIWFVLYDLDDSTSGKKYRIQTYWSASFEPWFANEQNSNYNETTGDFNKGAFFATEQKNFQFELYGGILDSLKFWTPNQYYFWLSLYTYTNWTYQANVCDGSDWYIYIDGEKTQVNINDSDNLQDWVDNNVNKDTPISWWKTTQTTLTTSQKCDNFFNKRKNGDITILSWITESYMFVGCWMNAVSNWISGIMDYIKLGNEFYNIPEEKPLDDYWISWLVPSANASIWHKEDPPIREDIKPYIEWFYSGNNSLVSNINKYLKDTLLWLMILVWFTAFIFLISHKNG